MSKMTFRYTASFDLTAVVDTAKLDEIVTELREVRTSEASKLDVTTKVLMGLVLQAYDRSPEQGYAELVRTSVRTELNQLVRDELLADDEALTIRHSPAKVVCHGIEI